MNYKQQACILKNIKRLLFPKVRALSQFSIFPGHMKYFFKFILISDSARGFQTKVSHL